jgi:hypothetical protein
LHDSEASLTATVHVRLAGAFYLSLGGLIARAEGDAESVWSALPISRSGATRPAAICAGRSSSGRDRRGCRDRLCRLVGDACPVATGGCYGAGALQADSSSAMPARPPPRSNALRLTCLFKRAGAWSSLPEGPSAGCRIVRAPL